MTCPTRFPFEFAHRGCAVGRGLDNCGDKQREYARAFNDGNFCREPNFNCRSRTGRGRGAYFPGGARQTGRAPIRSKCANGGASTRVHCRLSLSDALTSSLSTVIVIPVEMTASKLLTSL